ncbi:hypothetical protein [Scytonema sp. PRP1]|uniref:hypothetical protein n=1 Tax=Scytonema sp. PRP1 TaxID=3120513 RepID=UPI00300D3DE7
MMISILHAVRLADLLQAAGTRLVTTQAVLLEIGNALSRQRYRRAAVVLLNAHRNRLQGRNCFLIGATLYTSVPIILPKT